MALNRTDLDLARLRLRLHPYANALLERAARYALELHADELGLEHFLCIMMQDEDCAAYCVALHAFADPDSIFGESLAIASGILVVGSSGSTPFSVRAVAALRRARALAAERGRSEVGAEELLAAALEGLDDGPRAKLIALGFSGGEPSAPQAPGHDQRLEAEPLFKRFSTPAKQILSAAARIAAPTGLRSISPAHVLLGCLRVGGVPQANAGVTVEQALACLGGRTEDPTPPEARELPADPGVKRFLGRLPEGADTLAVLEGLHGPETREIAQVLLRHKVTPALLLRSRGVFRDPTDPPASDPP